MKDLSARISSLYIDPAIMNASGILPYAAHISRLLEHDIGAGILKTTGVIEKNGNESPVFVRCSEESYLNAVGLNDPGYEQIVMEANKYYPMAKPLIVSLSARNEKELKTLIDEFDNSCDAYELNCSCPNISPGEEIGVTIGNDPKRIESYTKAAKNSTNKPIIVKFGPGLYIYNESLFHETIDAAINSGVDAISAINTIPGGMKINIEAKHPILSAKYGGESGKAIKPIGVGCVYSIRDKHHDIPIIGIGGIETAEDIIEYVEAGANAVGIGTYLGGKSLKEIDTYLSQLKSNLEKLLDDFNVESIQDLRGIAHG